MKKVDLAKRLARESHRSQGKAADAVDALVHKILKGFRAAKETVPVNYCRAPDDPSIGKKAPS